jgi:hypothetical protein
MIAPPTSNPFAECHPAGCRGHADGIEPVAVKVMELRDAMLSLTYEYRWIATPMVIAEIADIYRCVYEDRRWFEQNCGSLRDIGNQIAAPVRGFGTPP